MNKKYPNLDKSLFNIEMPTGTPTPGALLVAEPFLREENFNHAVILLIDHETGGNSMGIVLNKPTGHTLGEAIEGFEPEIDIPLYCGGPVGGDRLFYIHTLGNEIANCSPLGGGLYIGGDFESIKSYLKMGLPTEGVIRFFIGYSGWDEGQLEEEIANHTWAITQMQSGHKLLEEDANAMWHNTVRSMGETYKHWLYHPEHPQMN